MIFICMFGKRGQTSSRLLFGRTSQIYMRSSITEGRGFTPEDLIRQGKEDQHLPQDENLESVSSPKKK